MRLRDSGIMEKFGFGAPRLLNPAWSKTSERPAPACLQGRGVGICTLEFGVGGAGFGLQGLMKLAWSKTSEGPARLQGRGVGMCSL